MKRGLMMIALLLIISAACNDSNSSSQPQVSQTKDRVQQGNWVITYFWDTDKDETSNFSGYSFTFNSDGSLVASKNSTTVTGSWSVTSDGSGDDDSSSDDIDFNIAFASPIDFVELTEDWHIISTSDSKIELTHVSGGNGGTDFLTFEKP